MVFLGIPTFFLGFDKKHLESGEKKAAAHFLIFLKFFSSEIHTSFVISFFRVLKMPECCISDCKSGRKKFSRKKTAKNPEPEIVQSFPFPTETTARNRWLRQCGFGKNLSQGARICAKHFRDSCFLSPSENLDDRDRSRARLRWFTCVLVCFTLSPTTPD